MPDIVAHRWPTWPRGMQSAWDEVNLIPRRARLPSKAYCGFHFCMVERRANPQDLTAKELESFKQPNALSAGSIVRQTRQVVFEGLAAVECDVLLTNATQRLEATMRWVPTRDRLYAITVAVPEGRQPPAALLDALRFAVAPVSPQHRRVHLATAPTLGHSQRWSSGISSFLPSWSR